MSFFQIQETPSVFINTDYIERFQFSSDAAETGSLTIHFVSGENVTFTGDRGPAAYKTLLDVLAEDDHDDE